MVHNIKESLLLLLYRHRGHRYITTREFKTALKAFKKAAEVDLTTYPS